MRKSFLFVGLFFLFVSGLSFAQDKNISNGVFDTEPFIAVNPVNPKNLVAAWMKATGLKQITICSKASMDGGLTWSSVAQLPHISKNFTSADVSIAFHKSGTACICYIDYKLNLDSGYVRVASSTNGGTSWNAPVNAIDAKASSDLPVDRPWLVVDHSSSTFGGRMYIVSKSYFGASGTHKIWFASSSDSGKSWSPIKQLDASIPIGLFRDMMGVPTAGPDGSLYVAYFSYSPSINPSPRIICLRSGDGGASFIPSTVAMLPSNAGITDTLYQGSFSISANPADAKNLVFQFTDQRNGDPDILSYYSVDGGQTWSSNPVRINDDAKGNGSGQDMSWGSFSLDGAYAVCWRDRRNYGTSSTDSFEIYSAVSTDGGKTFQANKKMSAVPSPFINIQRGNDFIGTCLSDTTLYSDWCDKRSGQPQIFFSAKALPKISTGMENNTGALEFNVYPNPARHTLHIDFEKETDGSLSVIDMNSKFILRKNFGARNLNILTDGIKPGSYLIKIQFANGSEGEKIIFIH